MEKPYNCPWQAGPILTASIRKLLHNPERILSPYVAEGKTAMDIGCGMGFFTLPMSRIVGKNGTVIAVDLQPKMLEGLKKNADREYAGETEENNITLHQCAFDSLQVGKWNGTVDFALIFWMLHEVPDSESLIRELHAVLSPKGRLLFVEPMMHVSDAKFQNSLNIMMESGFMAIYTPKITMSRAALLVIKK